ncbi:HK97 gp10 family phage protein [Lysobacter sp. 5GHs7-4]|uniref:HK97-gp10 family putative phage morphogenesis protein n=1 Tax=Lysobacter sp. 5GHs7-4 TaxID=2904253 RepID=UPI001E5D4792|nr:HK97-gp10 family putative phage morphogenesis protein [Lysobacter sp. 5GHs7-4]UHQ21888.1 HK97 gp10 family phage protein [Lysobacter sp. 5GHs7-4]
MGSESFIKGAAEVERKLRALSPQLQRKALNQAMRKGMAPVKRAAVTRARAFDDPATAQSIAKEIVIRSNRRKGRQLGGFVVQVGVRGGARAYVSNKGNRRAGRVGKSYEGGGNVFHWRFLEFGTAKMRAQPFMRPALSENVDAVTNITVSELSAAIDKIIAKGGF